MTGDRPTHGLAWHGSAFVRGLVYALPATVAGVLDPLLGLALAVGVLPVAAFPLPRRKRARIVLALLGVVSAACFLLGSLLAPHPVIAVIALFVGGIAFGWWARDAVAGRAAMTLCLPLIGIGLSFDDFDTAVAAAVLMIVGSLYAWVVSLPWVERAPAPPGPAGSAAAAHQPPAGYPLLLGLTGAMAAAIGFGLELEHVGWVTAAALFVLRPDAELMILRVIGRVASVAAGALAAALLAWCDAGPVVGVAVAALALGALAATVGSRWYVAPAFTTYIVLSLILVAPGESPGGRFIERVGETGVGIGVAVVIGILLPVALRWARARRPGDRRAS
ncbi:MAG: FUSC family protein [Candidatus Microbacterium phytovorans]|uniref:FUSC family protein n=1 Tax=Candidatus Microbacterium phytovorans TaxID=3121374 RepID=A0AAJ6B296_9MICO|nr:FUSC family protein [Microbacterium sp.]WEK12948.1 MAG: FUSC family protein [Microbacterium sp.]